MSALFSIREKNSFKYVEGRIDLSGIAVNGKSLEYEILIDLEEYTLYLFQNNVLIKEFKCAGGKWESPSPIGTWKIIKKAKWGEGFRTEVGYGLNVPWGEFGIHGTLNRNSIGWASSHGCIRMKNEEVAELYKLIPNGTKVIIRNGPYGSFGKGLRNLKSGMYGADVLEIQKRLKELGIFLGIPNGRFGGDTEKAIIKYCEKNGLYKRKIIDKELQKHMGFEMME